MLCDGPSPFTARTTIGKGLPRSSSIARTRLAGRSAAFAITLELVLTGIQRWLHSLKPTVKKCAWSQEEDQTLLRLYEELGPKWSAIARSIEGRTDDACSKRYREALNPALKKDDWTLAEDDRLMEIIQRLGHQWALVAHELQRSSLACRNRYALCPLHASLLTLNGKLAITSATDLESPARFNARLFASPANAVAVYEHRTRAYRIAAAFSSADGRPTVYPRAIHILFPL